MRTLVQALKAVMPLFMHLSATTPAGESSVAGDAQQRLLPADATVYGEPTEHEAEVVDALSHILTCVCTPRNVKLLLLLPEALHHIELLRPTGNSFADARLLQQALSHEVCGKLLWKLLDWQTRCRKLLLQLLDRRAGVAQVLPPRCCQADQLVGPGSV